LLSKAGVKQPGRATEHIIGRKKGIKRKRENLERENSLESRRSHRGGSDCIFASLRRVDFG